MHRTPASGHHVLACEHGYPISQCRCPAPRSHAKPVIYEQSPCDRQHPTTLAPEHPPRASPDG